MTEADLPARMDENRGFDHGLFVPLKLMFPAADIPCVQLSLVSGLDPATHLRVGRALSRLLDGDVLVVGSGFSFHNLRALMAGQGLPDEKNMAFQEWLLETCTSDALSHHQREERLTRWIDASFARYCHPREEHLMPLHVCGGMAGRSARVVFDGSVLGKRALALAW